MKDNISKPNRRKAQANIKRKNWCNCDFALVSEGSKCIVCNRRIGRRRAKVSDAKRMT